MISRLLGTARRRPRRPIIFGTFRRTSPVSASFGFDRGTPIDRVYIERFLEAHRADIRGRVLEFGDRSYTDRFGWDRVGASDIFDVDPANDDAAFTGTLEDASSLPQAAFDCVICTQVLHLISDVRTSIRTLHASLRPGGVLLATMPGITQIDDARTTQWFWAVTRFGARELFAPVFGEDRIAVEAHGNVSAAVAFLHGLAAEELRPGQLSARDPRYDVLVTVRAVKGPAA